MAIGRSNALRQYLDSVASTGEWDFEVIKKLPIVPNAAVDDVIEMRTGVAEACKKITASRAHGARGEARRLAYEAAQRYGGIVSVEEVSSRGTVDPDEMDPRRLAAAVVDNPNGLSGYTRQYRDGDD